MRDPREYGLTPDDRRHELTRKLGTACVVEALHELDAVHQPSDRVLGAIVFLCRSGDLDDLRSLVVLANHDPARLLNAATVKDERG